VGTLAGEHARGLETVKMGEAEAGELLERLSTLAQAARVFGSAIADLDIHVNWSLKPRPGRATCVETDGAERRSVDLSLDLNRVIKLLNVPREQRERTYVEAFKAGFLYELGHIIHGAPSEPEAEAGAGAASEYGLSRDAADLLRRSAVAELIATIRDTLEDARVEQLLIASFRGARRHLEGHAQQAFSLARGRGVSPVNRLTAALFLEMWGRPDLVARADLPADVTALLVDLRPSLLAASSGSDSSELSGWVMRTLVPRIFAYLQPLGADEGEAVPQRRGSGSGVGAPAARQFNLPEDERSGKGGDDGPQGQSGGESGPKEEDRRVALMANQLRKSMAAPGSVSDEMRSQMRGVRTPVGESSADNQIILYPHVEGGTVVVDEIPVARAQRIAADDRVRGVLRDMVSLYGPSALEAFAAESGALRRAFQVNFERRHSGRYRSGRHIGVRNLRRFILRKDLRLFQRLEVPDRLSYYFHLLVDVSPSMLRDRNVQKALAVGYAFTEALERLRIPVDVSLYSSAISRVHDHRHDALEPFFGAGSDAGFGYFSSGTHEIEAVAFAKQVADQVDAKRKIIVVITDGQPNNQAVVRAGAADLSQYLRLTLIPWLQRAEIELLALGIGAAPSYHANSVGILSGWESIGVFMRLLDQIIAQSAHSHSMLWH
jgi:hypothetical protein